MRLRQQVVAFRNTHRRQRTGEHKALDTSLPRRRQHALGAVYVDFVEPGFALPPVIGHCGDVKTHSQSAITAASRATGSSTSPIALANWRPSSARSDDVSRCNTRGTMPRSFNPATRLAPTNPVPPVTNTFTTFTFPHHVSLTMRNFSASKIGRTGRRSDINRVHSRFNTPCFCRKHRNKPTLRPIIRMRHPGVHPASSATLRKRRAAVSAA